MKAKLVHMGQRPIHVVSAWAVENNLVPGQNKVDEKTNEIKAIPELLEVLCLKGCIVTIDAMGTQKDIAAKILEMEADYILQVMGNQATLLEDISLYFEEEVFLENKAELQKANRYFKEQNGRLMIHLLMLHWLSMVSCRDELML